MNNATRIIVDGLVEYYNKSNKFGAFAEIENHLFQLELGVCEYKDAVQYTKERLGIESKVKETA